MPFKNLHLAAIDEVPQDAVFDQGIVKNFTGGADLCGRPCYGRKYIRLTPTWSLLFLMNAAPTLKDPGDEAPLSPSCEQHGGRVRAHRRQQLVAQATTPRCA